MKTVFLIFIFSVSVEAKKIELLPKQEFRSVEAREFLNAIKEGKREAKEATMTSTISYICKTPSGVNYKMDAAEDFQKCTQIRGNSSQSVYSDAFITPVKFQN